MIIEAELKPCPFCGSEKVSAYHNNKICQTVECLDCGARMDEVPDAVERWNTRTGWGFPVVRL